MKRPQKKLTEAQVIRALNRLAKGWPDGYWLQAGGSGGTINLVKGNLGLEGTDFHEAIQAFFSIPSDGGDP